MEGVTSFAQSVTLARRARTILRELRLGPAGRTSRSRDRWRDASVAAVAPGRVDLTGDHVDYNDGFVLPMAIGHGVAVTIAPRDDHIVRACAAGLGDTREARIADIASTEERTARAVDAAERWFDYVAAVVWALHDSGLP